MLYVVCFCLHFDYRPSEKSILRKFIFLIYATIEFVDLSPAGSSKTKNKADQDKENPDDLREPSTEEDERLLSTLEYEHPVDDMKNASVTQNTTGEHSTGERKLIRIDRRSESY